MRSKLRVSSWQAQAIAIDPTGSAYVTGFTGSTNFPIVPNPGAAQPSYGGGYDAFVTKVNPTGTSFLYSTYLGGSAFDEGYGIAVDSAGDAYLAAERAPQEYQGGARVLVEFLTLGTRQVRMEHETRRVEALQRHRPRGRHAVWR